MYPPTADIIVDSSHELSYPAEIYTGHTQVRIPDYFTQLVSSKNGILNLIATNVKAKININAKFFKKGGTVITAMANRTSKESRSANFSPTTVDT